jgi:hypothetical protein
MYEKAGSIQRSKNSLRGARPIGYLSPKLSLSWGNIIFISLSPRYEAGRKGVGPPTHILQGSLKNFCPTIRPLSAQKNEPPGKHTNARCRNLQELGGEKPMMLRRFTIRSPRFSPDGCSPARSIPKWRRSKLLAKIRAYVAQSERFL